MKERQSGRSTCQHTGLVVDPGGWMCGLISKYVHSAGAAPLILLKSSQSIYIFLDMQYDESDGRFRIGFGKYYDGGG